MLGARSRGHACRSIGPPAPVGFVWKSCWKLSHSRTVLPRIEAGSTNENRPLRSGQRAETGLTTPGAATPTRMPS